MVLTCRIIISPAVGFADVKLRAPWHIPEAFGNRHVGAQDKGGSGTNER